MSNQVSLCKSMRFSIGFPITINKPQVLNSVQLESLETKKKTIYYVFVIKIRRKSVSRGNNKIIRKELSKLFSCDYLTICRNVAKEKRNREKRNQEKDDGLYLRITFDEYIKQNIIMAVLRKANFHSANIFRLMKNQS